MFIKTIISVFGISVLVQIIGLLRQILIATYFGATRNLDVYFMTFAVVNLMVFTFAVIFDTVGIPHLIQCKEEQGEVKFKELTGSIFTFALVFSLFLGAVFLLVIPIVIKFMAAGFSAEDKAKVLALAYYFIPWILVYFPFLALCSFYKSIKSFNIVFFGELLISIGSLIFLLGFHGDVKFIPLAYSVGYFMGFIILMTFSFKHFSHFGNIFNIRMRNFYKNFVQLFGANQVTSIYMMIERFIQSFLPAGGISILSYSGQITNNLSGLLTFRDIFIVPLSVKEGRSERLERIVIGLVMISIPVMSYMYFFAGDIVMLGFKHGKFDEVAVGLLTTALSVYALSLFPGVVAVPAFRIFQVIDKIKNTAIVNIFNILGLLSFSVILVFILKLGVFGFACAYVITSYLSMMLTFYLLYINAISFDYLRALKFLFFSLFVCLLSGVSMKSLIFPGMNVYLSLVIRSLGYFLVVVVCYLPLKGRLMQIVGFLNTLKVGSYE